MDIFEFVVPEGMEVGLIVDEVFELEMIVDNVLDDTVGGNGEMPQPVGSGEIVIS